MRKALFVTPVAPWNHFGGTATVSRNLATLFADQTQARICCLRGDEPGNYPRDVDNATVLSGPISALARRLKFFFDFSAASFAHRQFARGNVRRRFVALLADVQPDFVIFDHIFSAWLIDLVTNPSTRIVYIAHDDMVVYAESLLHLCPASAKRLRFSGLYRQYRRVQRAILHRSDFVLTMTPEDSARLAPTSRGPVEVAPLYFDLPDVAHRDDAAFRSLLVTGSFDTWEKQFGLTHFLEKVFAPLLRQRPAMRLVIAGRVPAPFRETIRMGEPQVRIVHAPSDQEMRGLLDEASAACVLDLQASGLKIKTIDLAAAGLPIVTWAPGLEGSGLRDGESCLCATSAEEFSRHLDRLFADGELRARLGHAAQEIVQTKFSRTAALARLQHSKLYAALAGIEATAQP